MNQMQQMLMQAQKMQRQLAAAKEELAAKEFVVKKAGIVEVVVLGDKTVKKVSIEPSALEPDSADMIEETIVLAINEALQTISEEESAIEERITGRSGGLF